MTISRPPSLTTIVSGKTLGAPQPGSDNVMGFPTEAVPSNLIFPLRVEFIGVVAGPLFPLPISGSFGISDSPPPQAVRAARDNKAVDNKNLRMVFSKWLWVRITNEAKQPTKDYKRKRPRIVWVRRFVMDRIYRRRLRRLRQLGPAWFESA